MLLKLRVKKRENSILLTSLIKSSDVFSSIDLTYPSTFVIEADGSALLTALSLAFFTLEDGFDGFAALARDFISFNHLLVHS